VHGLAEQVSELERVQQRVPLEIVVEVEAQIAPAIPSN
jgi:hypothetical protein